MKIAIWVISSVVVLAAIVAAIGIWFYQKEFGKEDPDYILSFIEEQAGTKNVALTIHYNQKNWVQVNEQESLPLASTVKILVALEYAQQAATGEIDPQQEISVKDLEKFYIPKTDGGAHQAWLQDIKQDQVSLEEVAKGMINYSSNANTEYLIDLLGLENINRNLHQLALDDHEPLYPFVSALAIPQQLIQQTGSKEKALEQLREMNQAEYIKRANEIHQEWLQSPISEQDKKQLIKDSDMDFQKVWSDRLPRATTAEYVSIMEKLNHKSFFEQTVYDYLNPVLEGIMDNPNNQAWLTHAGQKGGSTAFVLTMSMYATDKQGNQTELAFFANELTTIQQAKLSKNLNAFQLRFLTDQEFRETVKQRLSAVNQS